MLTSAVLLALSAIVVLSPDSALADDEWSVALSADAGSDGSNHSLEFGTRSGATAGFDSDGIDIPSPPPAPGAAFGASFRITDSVFPQLNGDYREPLPADARASIEWTLAVSSAAQPITLTWSDPAGAGLPSGVSLALAGGGTSVNMRSATTASFPSGTHTLSITASTGTSPTTVPTPPSTVPGDDEDSGDEDRPDSSEDACDDSASPASEVEPNEVIPGSQQALQCTALSVEPAQVTPGQEVTVSATICNPAEKAAGGTLTLELNGQPVESRTLSLSGGACEHLVFNTSHAVPGTCEVTIVGMTVYFSVVDASGTLPTTAPAPPQTGIDITGLVVFTAMVAILVAAIILVLRRR